MIGQAEEAAKHFKSIKLPWKNFPYMTISEERLHGYMRAVGLDPGSPKAEPASNELKREFSSLDHKNLIEIARGLKRCNVSKLKAPLDLQELNTAPIRGTEKLHLDRHDQEFVTVGNLKQCNG